MAIPYSRQVIEADDIEAVVEALKSPLITQGPKVQEFERAVADSCGARFAVAFCNGTAALHASCLAAGISQGDEGIVPPISFAATANCLAYAGAVPRFADVLPEMPLLSPDSVRERISDKTRVLIPVHFAGAAAPMPALSAIARDHELTVIEDACHALGGTYADSDGKIVKIGSCAHSDMTVFSFHPVKNITTGEGGMVTTNDEALFEKLKLMRQHGIVVPAPDSGMPAWYYEMRELGYNYRMTDIQAALGLSQLAKLDRFIQKKQKLFDRYRRLLGAVDGISLLLPPAGVSSALHLCVIAVDPGLDRDDLFRFLRARGVTCQLHYLPIYRHPYYQKHFPADPGAFPQSEEYFARGLSIPLFPTLTTAEQNTVVDLIKTWSHQQHQERRKPIVSEHRPERIYSGWPSGANDEVMEAQMGVSGGERYLPLSRNGAS